MAAGAPHRLFVYGTLKRGGRNHGRLAGQCFIGEARTSAGFTLYELDGYPGMVADPGGDAGVTGEIWEVNDATLAALDRFEGVDEGLYVRVTVALAAGPPGVRPEAYIYAHSIVGQRRLGSTWTA